MSMKETMTLQQARKEMSEREGKYRNWIKAIDAVLDAQPANPYEQAVIERAMVTECVSVDGRDPSDVIRDIISWHVAMDRALRTAEQPRGEPVAVVGDTYTLHWIGSGPIAPLIERHGIKKGDELYISHSPKETAAHKEQATCANCCGTGKLHRHDGEIVGACYCSAGHRIANEEGSTTGTKPEQAVGDGEAGFAAWFAKNYPGPDTIISDPNWHAPRIFRAAMYHAHPKPEQDDDLTAAYMLGRYDGRKEKTERDEALSRLVSFGNELRERDARVVAENWLSEYDALMARKPEQAVGDGVDISTSAGGRAYVAEFFRSHIGRHDFTRYIETEVAADFACALAVGLSAVLAAPRPAPVEVGGPVAVVCDTYELRWIGSGPIAPLIERHGIKKGDKLYTSPRQAVATPADEEIAQLKKRITELEDRDTSRPFNPTPNELYRLSKAIEIEREEGTPGAGPFQFAMLATPAEVTEEMCDALIFEFHKQCNGLGLETMRTKARRCLRAALTTQCQVRKDTQGLDDSGRLTPLVPYELADVVRAVRRFDECAEDGEDVDIGRDWFDALTTIGLLCRVQRSPARWEMTDAGRSLLDLASPSAGAVVPEYTTEMGEAGQKYIDSCVKNIQPQGFTLPALFRWHELFEAMLAAVPEAGADVRSLADKWRARHAQTNLTRFSTVERRLGDGSKAIHRILVGEANQRPG